jgi:hypothetical protein
MTRNINDFINQSCSLKARYLKFFHKMALNIFIYLTLKLNELYTKIKIFQIVLTSFLVTSCMQDSICTCAEIQLKIAKISMSEIEKVNLSTNDSTIILSEENAIIIEKKLKPLQD